MSRFLKTVCVLWLALCGGAQAQDLSALARAEPEGSVVRDSFGGIVLEVGLSQPVPYKLALLAAPPRLVADFREVDWRGLDADAFDLSDRVEAVAMGPLIPGWSRLVLQMDGPYVIEAAALTGTNLRVELAPASAEDFAAKVSLAQTALRDLPEPAQVPAPRTRQDGVRPLVVVLDPGHGGIDPGAQRDGHKEADLVLGFARELRDMLRRTGMDVVLTRDADIFVPLESRITIARAAGADAFISLHADALPEGHASGATVYTLSEESSDIAGKLLAERHDRSDLLAGVDLNAYDDVVSDVLMDLARLETAPRSDQLADTVVAQMRVGVGNLHKRPRQSAGFSVLKAPDIPSILIELGFMSSPRDLEHLLDPVWRGVMAAAIRDALLQWAQEDAAQAGLLRQ
ncbi:N-acetylmuramoyl-L-alanine amidase [Actibacterium atlanticum]|uniref:N-acetylmuramoyl-L-alanine amidase n=1 Tax=Actibacterium atlanticum TaxID=1461693 RepID=A0A058ZP84_9RHOB|nr:N-acetylmuramoyl-L-alanine amidase [Actibacterium atlanticum]KCV83368.1 N-acetylmuramoyl-L-alanine amidase [Actibacterium atlanticum]